MSVTVRPVEAGGFEVVKLVPELLGTFPDKDMAHKFALMIMSEDKVVAVITDDDPWTDDELDRAFSRLAQGEKLRVIADDFGKSWTHLRGKWAQFKSKYVGAPDVAAASPAQLPALAERRETPLEMVTGALTQMKDQQVCNLCGKHFNLTPDNLDTCQRCSHGA